MMRSWFASNFVKKDEEAKDGGTAEGANAETNQEATSSTRR